MFLDGLGIPHTDGVIIEDHVPNLLTEEGVLDKAVALLTDNFPSDDVALYFMVLMTRDRPTWGGLAKYLVALSTVADDEDAEELEADDDAPEGILGLEAELDEFTTLDMRFVRVAVDTVQAVEGAPTEDQLDDLVDELIQLNSSRHRSYFHAGFRDLLYNRPIASRFPEQNVERRRWYWAGYLHGLARQERWESVLEYFDSEVVVKSLGDTGSGPSAGSAWIVCEALCRANRSSEIASFLKPRALFASRRLRDMLFREGTRLLRHDDAPTARALFDLLWTSLKTLEDAGQGDHPSFVHLVRRRRANCLRQLGEKHAAGEQLRALLEDCSEEVRPRVECDIGLVEAGFRRLADLTLPDDQGYLDDFVEAVALGRDWFERAATAESIWSGHGHYCLGVFSFARGDYGVAAEHLDKALSLFESDPDTYRLGQLLENAQLYLGVALCHEDDATRLHRAARLIQAALEGGATIPTYLVESTIVALAISDDQLPGGVAETVLATNQGVLDQVVASSAVDRSVAVASALLTRAQDETSGQHVRLEDCRTVLPFLLLQGRLEDAAGVLTNLEEAAFHGVDREEFLEILDEPRRYEPAWEASDASWARVTCLEASGRYVDAYPLVSEEIHRLCSSNGFGDLDDAEALVARLATYPDISDTEALTARVKSIQEQGTTPDISPRKKPTRILFVGGDESQAGFDEALKEELRALSPPITVQFVHPGWSSNWGRIIRDLKQRAQQFDGVVVSRLNRTGLGRHLRSVCPVWRGCYGPGKQTVKRAILATAVMAEQHFAESSKQAS